MIKIRRIKTLGIALGLSAIAAAIGVACYSLPSTFATTNRIADYVVLNDALFWSRDQAWLDWVHFPDTDNTNDHIKFLAIDEPATLPPPAGFGQFPWPRSRYGNLLTRLGKAGAKIVTFDVLFVDPAQNPVDDQTFASGLRAQRTILPFTLATTSTGILNIEEPPAVLKSVAYDLGFTTVDTPGGWLVGQFFTMTAGPNVFHSLAGTTVEAFTGQKIVPVDDWHAKLGNLVLPLDGNGQFTMLPFKVNSTVDSVTGGSGATAARKGGEHITAPFMEYLSLPQYEAMDDATLKGFVHGNIVVVGPTAQGLGDFINTPNGRYPGVFANMRLMDQMISHKFVTRVPPWLDLGLIFLLPLFVGFVGTQLRATVGVIIAAAVVVVYSAISVAVYGFTLHWLNLIHVDVAIILAALFVALYRTITEGADKRVIREMFGKHVSPALVDQMLNHDDPKAALGLQGKRVRVTIFYSDIRGFTAMSEKMTPEQIYGQLNEYFEEMCTIVFKYGGYVDKFIGDCLMAVFSAPNPRPNDAYDATISALEQQEKILEMATAWAAEGRKVFTVGMGLNTGEVVMGNLGSSERLNYTVIGDNVNTAARLYNVAKGGQIIISESTYEEVKDRFIVNELQPVFVKGKELPLRNFEIIGRLEAGEENTSTLLDPNVIHEAKIAADH
jgi:adenylate cyclase